MHHHGDVFLSPLMLLVYLRGDTCSQMLSIRGCCFCAGRVWSCQSGPISEMRAMCLLAAAFLRWLHLN